MIHACHPGGMILATVFFVGLFWLVWAFAGVGAVHFGGPVVVETPAHR